MEILDAATYEFGPFRVEIDERRLFRSGQPVAIPPKAFDTLAVLIERRGRLVEKAELMERLWPASVVEDVNLARNISDLRKILGERSGGVQYIETVPKKGYRWVAEVHIPATAPATPKADVVPRRSKLVPIAVGVAVVSMMGAGWMIRARTSPGEKEVSPAKIAGRPDIRADGGNIGLLGTTVMQNVVYNTIGPGDSTSIVNTDTFKVGAEVEFSCPGPYHGCKRLVPTQTIDFKDLSIRYEKHGGTAAFLATVAPGFNGFDWEDLHPAGGPIDNVAIATNIPGLDRSRLVFTGNSIRLNMQGLTSSEGSFFELTLSVSPAAH